MFLDAVAPKSADQVIRLTEDMVAKSIMTIMVVTHPMQQAASLVDRLIMMVRGRLDRMDNPTADQ